MYALRVVMSRGTCECHVKRAATRRLLHLSPSVQFTLPDWIPITAALHFSLGTTLPGALVSTIDPTSSTTTDFLHFWACSSPQLYLARREASYLQLLRHPHILEISDVIENDKQIVIVSEWLRGGLLLEGLANLAECNQQEPPAEAGMSAYSEQQCAAIFSQVSSPSRRFCDAATRLLMALHL